MDLSMSLGKTSVSQIDLYRAVDKPLSAHLRTIGRRITVAAKAQVGKNTGDLARSIHFKIDRHLGLPGLWVGTYDSKARLHHEGTRPHVIRPTRAEFLRYSARGRVVYARQVMHPGTRPNRFLTDNIYLAKV